LEGFRGYPAFCTIVNTTGAGKVIDGPLLTFVFGLRIIKRHFYPDAMMRPSFGRWSFAF
jgi:hypothetical protein